MAFASMRQRRPSSPISSWILSAMLLIAGIAVSVSLPSARAPQFVKWFENQGIDQPINYINQPSAQYFQGWTYVAWQGTVDFLPYMKRYNHTTGSWGPTSRISDTNPISGDGHGAPAFFITPSGRIHVFYGAHLSPLKYVRGDVATFGVWVTRPDPDDHVTYPHVVYAGDPKKLWLFYRSGDACGSWGDRVSANDGDTWSGEGTFLNVAGGAYVGGITADNTGLGIYIQYAPLKNDCSTDTTNRTGSYVSYYLPDNGNQFWCKAFPADIPVGFAIDTLLDSCAIEAKLATGAPIPKASCYADSELLDDANACDDDDLTQWLSANFVPYPHYVIVNLTSTFRVKTVSLKTGNYPSTGHIDRWNGAAWVSVGAYTTSIGSNTSVNVADFDGDRLRVYGDSSPIADEHMGFFEVWAYGESTVSNFGMVRKQTGTFTGDEVFAAYITGTSAPVGTWSYKFAAFNGATWDIGTIAYGDHFQDYIDFREVSATSMDAFLMTNATDSDGSKEGGNMVTYHWNGVSWTVNGTLITAAESGQLLSAPVVPIDSVETAQVFFDQRVITLTEANQKLYVWGSGGFLGHLEPSTGALAFTNYLFLAMAVFVMVVGAGLYVARGGKRKGR